MMTDNEFFRKKFSHRYCVHMLQHIQSELDPDLGTYVWSYDSALARMLDSIRAYKRDAKKYREIKHLLK